MNQRLVWNFEYSAKKSTPLLSTSYETDEVKWEMRFFWPEDRIITLHPIEERLLDLGNYKQKHREDYYYLLPGHHYNIKIRRDELLYKPIIKQTSGAVGFGAKINLGTVDLASCNEAEHILKIQKLVQKTKKQRKKVCVKKEAFVYSFKTHPATKLELARIEVNNKIYFSLCIEGKSLYLVETISKYLLDESISCEYVSFLNDIIT